MFTSILAICAGASGGAVLRWLISSWLNAMHSAIPLGTLAVNLAGGYFIGVALAVFAVAPAISTEWRLLITTGFLGGFTTFSAFSGEVVTMLQQGRMLAAAVTVAAHVGGSLAMTALGLATVAFLIRLSSS